jgi:glyoxylase-like metal-dependent hydrolase (beta-lactamase superfamily II)/8-oxo-dGTP pyrophosphatase MutT (NUDIX family)
VSERPGGVPPARVPTPRDSASAIVLRESAAGGWEVLLGLRSRRSRFLPGHLACPGGGLEPADRPGEPGAFRRCVGRELREETGLDLPEAGWLEAGERITPPLFPLRFRTRFFVAPLPDLPPAASLEPASGENESLRLARPAAVLRAWDAGEVKLPPPILPILRVLAEAAGEPLAEIARRVAAVNSAEERAPRVEFAPNLWMLPMRSATLPPASHTNLWMPGGRHFLLVDPGSGEEDERARLLEVVGRRRALGHRPVAVLLTHHHRDHVAGAAPVARALALPVRAHEATFDLLATALDGLDRSPIADGETLDLAGTSLTALHTPGHASGHLVLHDAERGLLVAGDLISGMSTILIDPDEGDMDVYLDSLARAERLGCRMLLPGHGPPLPGKRLGALIEHRRQREERVVAALASGPASLSRIASAAYADTPGLPEPLIESQTRAHLVRLERRGTVERVQAEDTRWRAWGRAT